MIRNAADEYGSYGVRFNAVQTGFITTEVMEAIPRGGRCATAMWTRPRSEELASQRTSQRSYASSSQRSPDGSPGRRSPSTAGTASGGAPTTPPRWAGWWIRRSWTRARVGESACPATMTTSRRAGGSGYHWRG